MVELDKIGFYTLTDARARQASGSSPMWRCELILTDACNFRCVYCRGLPPHLRGDMHLSKAKWVVDAWVGDGLKNVRFSGGEPMVWPYLLDLVEYTAPKVDRLAISTNGSFPLEAYERLVDAGVDDFSISLDACCSATADRMAGLDGYFRTIVSNIEALSRLTYVTVGIVLAGANIDEAQGIIGMAHDMGVADIRIISAAQWNELLEGVTGTDEAILEAHPVLRYRIEHCRRGRNVRGLRETDTHKCHLVKDDSIIVRNWHFPCVIHMREGGKPIGRIAPDDMRRERLRWFRSHDSHLDPICREQCLDVCIDYNNRCEALH